jgi:hypothetical protein
MSSSSSDTILAEQGMRLVGPGHTIVPIMAGLCYSRQDPYAVTMAFGVADAGEPVTWTFARDLLAAALHAPEGIGDVHAWPSAASAGRAAGGASEGEEILNIELGSPFGRARFEARAAEIEAFLARTYQLVPAGQEPAYLNFDAELTELLGQA